MLFACRHVSDASLPCFADYLAAACLPPFAALLYAAVFAADAMPPT